MLILKLLLQVNNLNNNPTIPPTKLEYFIDVQYIPTPSPHISLHFRLIRIEQTLWQSQEYFQTVLTVVLREMTYKL